MRRTLLGKQHQQDVPVSTLQPHRRLLSVTKSITTPSQNCLKLTGEFDEITGKSASAGVDFLVVRNIFLALGGRDDRFVLLESIYRDGLLQMFLLRGGKV